MIRDAVAVSTHSASCELALFRRTISLAIGVTTRSSLRMWLSLADEVTGGGFVIAGPGGVNVPNVAIQRSYAVDDNTWLVRAVATSGTPNWQLTGIATCAF